MPLPERVIVPVAVCRGTLQLPVPDELEGVTNGSLANITRQLSTLSRHAEEMFGNLFREAEILAVRGSSLQARIDKIAVKVTQLDSNVEEVTLQEIQLRKAFRSTQTFDQQVVSRDTMPKSMLEQYLGCDKPPPLHKLNPYREDGKDGLKFYTDANYFFELWSAEMKSSMEKAEKGRRGGLKSSRPGGQRSKRPVRQPHNTTERQRQDIIRKGEHIMDESLYTDGGRGTKLSVSFNLPDKNGFGPVPGGYDPSDLDRSGHRPNTIDIQGGDGSGYYGGYDRGGQGAPDLSATQRVVRFEDTSRYTQEPIYTPRVLRDPERSPSHHERSFEQRSVQFELPTQMSPQQLQQHTQHMQQMQQLRPDQQQLRPDQQLPESPADSRSGTPQRRPSNPPPAPPPTSTPTRTGRAGSSGRDSLPPPPPPPANEMAGLSINGSPVVAHNTSNGGDPDLPPPPPVPDTLSPGRVPLAHMAPSPPPPPAPWAETSPTRAPPAPPAPPPPPPLPPPTMNGIKANGDINRPQQPGMAGVLSSIVAGGQSHLKKATPLPRNPETDVRSDLLTAIRQGISLKAVEKKADMNQAAGLSDVASILARRVALEVSDSDDGPSDSEYDSDDWGETDA